MRYLLACLSLGSLLLPACSSHPAPGAADASAPAATAPSTGDFVTWTQNGQAYRATDVSAYTYQGMQSLAFNGAIVSESQGTSARTLTVTIPTAQLRPGTYELRRAEGGKATGLAAGSLLLSPADTAPRSFSTLAGPAATNGRLTLTECDPKAQRLAGTFEFTAQAFEAGQPATQQVTAGAFRISRVQAAPGGM